MAANIIINEIIGMDLIQAASFLKGTGKWVQVTQCNGQTYILFNNQVITYDEDETRIDVSISDPFLDRCPLTNMTMLNGKIVDIIS